LSDDRAVKIVTRVAEVPRLHGKRVLVPTMGALHEAHRQLIRIARQHAGPGGEVAVSIFVNPLQFEPGSDFERYPRPEQEDESFCGEAGADLLFRPGQGEMYAVDRSAFVEETALASTLEGKSHGGGKAFSYFDA
jgi:pantoate--beta-alanine ligase